MVLQRVSVRASHKLTTSQRPTVAGSCGRKAALKDGPAPTGQDTHPRVEKTKEAGAGNKSEAASPTHKSGYTPREFSLPLGEIHTLCSNLQLFFEPLLQI